MLQTRRRRLILVLGLAILLLMGLLRPADRGGPYDPAFAQWNQLLKTSRPGAPTTILDLDTLDHNAQLIRQRLGKRFELRLVTKSIPSIPLISHLMQVTGTRKLMAFSEALLGELLKAFGDTTDILLGKSLPVESAARLLALYPAAANVQWLVDSQERAQAFLALAEQRGHALKLSVEIDVGLHRGGVRDRAELEATLQVLRDSQGKLLLTGFMGYDGHVPYVPAPVATETAVQFALQDVLEQYASFVTEGRTVWPEAFASALTFNSGGSHTFALYSDVEDTPVNDLAIGSAFLSPGNFAGLEALGLKPAFYLATPVLKRVVPGDIPFLGKASGLLAWWDPNLTQGYGLLGGGWTASPAQPPGLTSHFLVESEGGVESLLSNQRMLYASPAVKLDAGDFVFLRPWEGDALLTFDRIDVVRGGKLVETWSTFRGGGG